MEYAAAPAGRAPGEARAPQQQAATVAALLAPPGAHVPYSAALGNTVHPLTAARGSTGALALLGAYGGAYGNVGLPAWSAQTAEPALFQGAFAAPRVP